MRSFQQLPETFHIKVRDMDGSFPHEDFLSR
jgi:hypothetical protein